MLERIVAEPRLSSAVNAIAIYTPCEDAGRSTLGKACSSHARFIAQLHLLGQRLEILQPGTLQQLRGQNTAEAQAFAIAALSTRFEELRIGPKYQGEAATPATRDLPPDLQRYNMGSVVLGVQEVLHTLYSFLHLRKVHLWSPRVCRLDMVLSLLAMPSLKELNLTGMVSS
jgi:hypothetical protein